MNDALRPTVAYLGRLKRRMEKRGFPPDDRLMQLVTQAQAVMQDLSMELQYLACKRAGAEEDPSGMPKPWFHHLVVASPGSGTATFWGKTGIASCHLSGGQVTL